MTLMHPSFKQSIHSAAAPAPVGTYSQAIAVPTEGGRTVWLSGQIGLDPATGQMVASQFEPQARQVFANLAAVAHAAGGTLDDVVKINLYLTDLAEFPIANKVMAEFFAEPYPARSTLGVSVLPRGALFEADAVLVLRP